MVINIDENSGFCWGVVRAVEFAEKELNESKTLFCLGEIIHNPIEIERLNALGLKTISYEDLSDIKNATVLIRAHGEPPSTYELAKEKNIDLIDATCPIVTKVQERIKSFFEKGYQIIIFGKKEHPEVIGLNGVCDNKAIIIKTEEESKNIQLLQKNVLFSQTTMNINRFKSIVEIITKKAETLKGIIEIEVIVKDTICRSVSGRENHLKKFAKQNDLIIFVSGKNSSNGKFLYEVCKSCNSKIHFIEKPAEIESGWLLGADSIGITGATSTPKWVLENVKETIMNMKN